MTGGISNVILTGKPKAFLAGFGQAFATYGVGHGLFPGNPVTGKVKFGSGDHFGRVIGHGVIGGSFAEIHGGKFSAGFSSAAFTSAAGPLVPDDYWEGFAVSVTIGGTGSVLGGGKFADGAVTAAFVYLFNERGSNKCTAAKTATAATCGLTAGAATACALTTAGVTICGPVVLVGAAACVVSAAATYACENVVYNDGADEGTDEAADKEPKPGVSGKDGAKDVPSWAQGERPKVGESGKDFAKRLLDGKYGSGNYPTGPGSEYSKIKKWGDRAFQDPS